MAKIKVHTPKKKKKKREYKHLIKNKITYLCTLDIYIIMLTCKFNGHTIITWQKLTKTLRKKLKFCTLQ